MFKEKNKIKSIFNNISGAIYFAERKNFPTLVRKPLGTANYYKALAGGKQWMFV